MTERESGEDRGNGLTNDNDRHGNHLLANDEKRRDREDDGPDQIGKGNGMVTMIPMSFTSFQSAGLTCMYMIQ